MKFPRNLFLFLLFADRHGFINGQHPNPPTFKVPSNDAFDIGVLREKFDGNDPEDGGECGLTCVGPDQYPLGLLACLSTAFEDNNTGEIPIVTLGESYVANQTIILPKVVFSPATTVNDTEFNLNEYNKARFSQQGGRLPAAILFAESKADVIKGVNCARVNGYKVSPRGRGHDYSSISALEGSLVIDLQLNCKMENFKADKESQGPGIMKGSRYIGTMTAPSGCANAAFIAAVNRDFSDDRGIGVIGSCPSVGITGFFLNGGFGDTSNYAGLGADLIDEIEMVLYNGTSIKASASENEDIFWASKGGTGGIGVITSFTERIVESPSTVVTFVKLNWGSGDYKDPDFLEKQVDILMNFQDLIYRDGSKFGGAFISSINTTNNEEYFYTPAIYLGSIEDFVKEFHEAGLLGAEYVATAGPGTAGFRDGTQLCGDEPDVPSCDSTFSNDGFPQKGLTFGEYKTQAEAQAVVTCNSYLVGLVSFYITGRAYSDSVTMCDELGISNSLCAGLNIEPSGCYNSTTVDAILEAFSKPKGFLNRKGNSFEWVIDGPVFSIGGLGVGQQLPDGQGAAAMGTGGLMIPALKRETFKKLLNETTDKWNVNHLVHGAPLRAPSSATVSSDSTGYPHRNALYNLPVGSRTPKFVEILLEDPVYDNKAINLQIYGNYPPSLRIPNYERHVYVDQLEELSRIRTKHDPLGGFDSPRYPARDRGAQRTKKLEFWKDPAKKTKKSKSKNAKLGSKSQKDSK